MADETLGLVLLLVYVGVIIAFIASFWKMFVKAGQPGWASIIPIYSIFVLLKIVCRSSWWPLLYIIPAVNAIIYIVVILDLAKRFDGTVP